MRPPRNTGWVTVTLLVACCARCAGVGASPVPEPSLTVGAAGAAATAARSDTPTLLVTARSAASRPGPAARSHPPREAWRARPAASGCSHRPAPARPAASARRRRGASAARAGSQQREAAGEKRRRRESCWPDPSSAAAASSIVCRIAERGRVAALAARCMRVAGPCHGAARRAPASTYHAGFRRVPMPRIRAAHAGAHPRGARPAALPGEESEHEARRRHEGRQGSRRAIEDRRHGEAAAEPPAEHRRAVAPPAARAPSPAGRLRPAGRRAAAGTSGTSPSIRIAS